VLANQRATMAGASMAHGYANMLCLQQARVYGTALPVLCAFDNH